MWHRRVDGRDKPGHDDGIRARIFAPFIVDQEPLETIMINLATPEIWFVCGSQHLYGPGPLKQVAANAREIAGALTKSPKLPLKTPLEGPESALP